MDVDLLRARGLFTAAQARHLGVSAADLQAGVRTEALVRVRRGWYVAAPFPDREAQHRALVEAQVRHRTEVLPSHYSALVYARLPVHRPDLGVVHLMRTRPGPAQRRPGLVIHPQHGEQRHMTIALAVCQTALLCPISALMSADAALARSLVTADDLGSAAAWLARRHGRAGVAPVLRLADGRRESPLESWTAWVFDQWGVVLVPQFEVPGTDYRADARVLGTRVLIEVDGRSKYDDADVVFREKNREDAVRVKGWQVLRVTADCLNRPSQLRARLDRSWQRARALPATG